MTVGDPDKPFQTRAEEEGFFSWATPAQRARYGRMKMAAQNGQPTDDQNGLADGHLDGQSKDGSNGEKTDDQNGLADGHLDGQSKDGPNGGANGEPNGGGSGGQDEADKTPVPYIQRAKDSLSNRNGNPDSRSIGHREHLVTKLYYGQATAKIARVNDEGKPANLGQDKFPYPVFNHFDAFDDDAPLVIPEDLFGVRLQCFQVYRLVLQTGYDYPYLSEHFDADFSRTGLKENRIPCGRGAVVKTDRGMGVGTLGANILHGDAGERMNRPNKLDKALKGTGLGVLLSLTHVPLYGNAIPTNLNLQGLDRGYRPQKPKIATVTTQASAYSNLLTVVLPEGDKAPKKRAAKKDAPSGSKPASKRRANGKKGTKDAPINVEEPDAYRLLSTTPDPEAGNVAPKDFEELFLESLQLQKTQSEKLAAVNSGDWTAGKKPEIDWQKLYERSTESIRASHKLTEEFKHANIDTVRRETREELNKLVKQGTELKNSTKT
ncbi:MAG: hypothetical protein Q9169_007707 [Polycauliona sp. 2 TL-2023]